VRPAAALGLKRAQGFVLPERQVFLEITTTGFQRLTDDDWAGQVNAHGAGVTNPVWVQPILSQP
jgi:hypothetical protein